VRLLMGSAEVAVVITGAVAIIFILWYFSGGQ
jgi:hypothetical protein